MVWAVTVPGPAPEQRVQKHRPTQTWPKISKETWWRKKHLVRKQSWNNWTAMRRATVRRPYSSHAELSAPNRKSVTVGLAMHSEIVHGDREL